ncbi:phospholipase/carboxylesterase [Comamonas humi]
MLDLPLQHLYRPAAIEAAGAGEAWLLVLMHGVGSNEQDLFGLADYLPAQFHVLSLRAPITLGPNSYGWFQFGLRPDGGRIIDEAQEQASRALIEQTCVAAGQQLQVPPARTVLGGFSQGGIMALSLLLTRPALLQAAMVWHGRLLAEMLAQQAAPAELQGHGLWVSHGTQDDVIPLAMAHRVRDHVQPLPLALNYREYPCRHELHPQELRDSVLWLKSLAGTY